MAKTTKFSFVLLLCLQAIFVYAAPEVPDQNWPTQLFNLKGKPFQLQIANTMASKRQGLMYRDSLDNNAGMLFVYSNPGNHGIWMKNTLIPLTVIWLDDQAMVIDVKSLLPCKQHDCPVSTVPGPSKYILELHIDEKLTFNIGDRLPQILNWEPPNN